MYKKSSVQKLSPSQENKKHGINSKKTQSSGKTYGFVVKLPFKESPESEEFLGNSYKRAYTRMIQLEKRFERNPELAREYRRSMHEAIEAGHLRRCSKEEVEARKNAYFIPHHPVIKQSRTTTKVRPVCDALAKSSHGSLNDRMLVGPTVHMDIFSILVRWRMFKIAYAGDCHERK